ncbi:arylesterase [Alphaproteobacteria bacterium]|nr:arylesterase [Alphaproteobacteria bacterium]
MNNIIIVGASITQGYWDTEGGWATRIKREYIKRAVDKKDYDVPMVFNLGISGNDAIKILKRLDVELQARAKNRDDLVLFFFGTNDSSHQQGKFIETPAEFKQNIEKIVETTQKYTDNIIFGNILPCDDKIVQPVAWNDTVFYYNSRIIEFNSVIQEFCADNDIKMIDVYTPFAAESQKQNLLEDGLHPNDVGHKLVFEIIMKELEEVK